MKNSIVGDVAGVAIEGMQNSIVPVSVDCNIARAFAQHVLHTRQLLMSMTAAQDIAGVATEGMKNCIVAASVDCNIARAFARHELRTWQLLMGMTPVSHVA